MGLFVQVMIAMILSLMLGISMTYHTYKDAINFYEHTESVLEACEKDLPRSKSCEVIVAAKVKGGE